MRTSMIIENCGQVSQESPDSESTRLRMGESLPNHHEDQIAAKGSNSLQRYNLVHKFIPMPQAMKFWQRKQRWTRNGNN